MDSILNQPMEDSEDVIDMKEFSQAEDANDGVIDMKEYSGSPEDESASWWDVAKDVIVQPALGIAQAYTWPADVLKIGMMGEGLSDLDELEDAFKKAGKPFDRNEYIRKVAETSQYVPTQSLLEDVVSAKTGISLEPKSESGKWIRKFFNLRQLTRGAGLGKSLAAGATGATTTSALRQAGAPELVSELTGDIGAGAISSIAKSPRVLSPEVAKLEATAAKHGLPFPEYLTKEPSQLVHPKISDARRLALQKDLGMDSEQAIEKVLEGTLNAAQMKKAGHNLEILYTDAYDTARKLASQNPKPVPPKNLIAEINGEINRIKNRAPSLSDGQKAAVKILENERDILEKAPANAEQLINQIQNYNSNVKSIYKKPEFSGIEEEVRNAYGFLNNSIRNTLQNEVDPSVRHVLSAGDKIFSEAAKLDRVEGLVTKAFHNGDYNPKKLSQLLNSSQGNIVRRELGDKAVSQLKDIASYGEQAVKATNQLAKSSSHMSQIAEWGPLAGFIFHKIPKGAAILSAAIPIGNRIKGYLLTQPSTREVYRDIMKNAAKGSFKTLPADFARLEAEISKQFGSVDEFIKSMESDLELIEE